MALMGVPKDAESALTSAKEEYYGFEDAVEAEQANLKVLLDSNESGTHYQQSVLAAQRRLDAARSAIVVAHVRFNDARNKVQTAMIRLNTAGAQLQEATARRDADERMHREAAVRRADQRGKQDQSKSDRDRKWFKAKQEQRNQSQQEKPQSNKRQRPAQDQSPERPRAVPPVRITTQKIQEWTKASMKEFPQAPSEPCSEADCAANEKTRALRACRCNITKIFSSRNKAELKMDRVRYHPDKFSTVPGQHRDQIQQAAKEVFSVVQEMYTSRQPKRSTEDSLFAEILATPATVRLCLSFYTKPADTDPSIDEVSTLFIVGDGMNGHAGILHGGIVASVIDEAMGIMMWLNLEREREMLEARASKGLADGENPNRVGSFTATLDTKFLKPILTPGSFLVTARYLKKEGRKTWVGAEIKQHQKEGETVCATGEAPFIEPRASKL
ncbi:hypothetical protein LTR17_020251 [Elasticomyces elasticus]|nr:hypothetical protein LTR17_020251 [Elasticomyces elasticus]